MFDPSLLSPCVCVCGVSLSLSLYLKGEALCRRPLQGTSELEEQRIMKPEFGIILVLSLESSTQKVPTGRGECSPFFIRFTIEDWLFGLNLCTVLLYLGVF